MDISEFAGIAPATQIVLNDKEENRWTLKFPKDITAYEAAQMSVFLFLLISNSSRWHLVKGWQWDLALELGIQRLFIQETKE